MPEKILKELLNVLYSEDFDKITSQGSEGLIEQSELKEMEKVVSIVIIRLIKEDHSAFEYFRTVLEKSGSKDLVQKLGE